jgi:hypothetical protein
MIYFYYIVCFLKSQHTFCAYGWIFSSKQKKPPSGVFHKAGFTYRKKQICRGDQWSPAKNVKKIKRAIRKSPLQQKDREHENSLSFFHTPCPARYSVLHLLSMLSGGKAF